MNVVLEHMKLVFLINPIKEGLIINEKTMTFKYSKLMYKIYLKLFRQKV